MTTPPRFDPGAALPPPVGTFPSSRDGLWLVGLILVFVVQWATLLFSDQTFYLRDLFFFFAPLLVEAGRQMMSGVFPAWNPHLGGGTPLAADPNVGVFFPDMILFPILGAGPEAVKVLLLGRLLILSLCAYAALRAVALSPAAAFLGAALVSLSGPVSSSLSSFPPILAGSILFLPLAALGFRMERRGRAALVLAAVLFALLFFAGSPDMVIQGALIFVLSGLGPSPRKTISRLAVVLAGGLLLAAPQILPAALLLPRTPRGQGLELTTPPGFLSFPPVRLLEFLWPGLLGDATQESPLAFWGRGFSPGVTPYLSSVAVGLVPLVLLPFALRHRFGKRLGVGAAVFALFSFGKFLPLGEQIFGLPLLRALRFPEKWMIGVALTLAGLAAVGLDEFQRSEERKRAGLRIVGVVAVLSGALAVLSAAWPKILLLLGRAAGLVEAGFPEQGESLVARTAFREGLTALGISLLLWLVLRLRGIRRFSLLPLLLILVALLERLPRATRATATTSIALFSVPSQGARRAREAAGDGRFFYDKEATTLLDPMRPFTGILFGLSYAGNTDVDQFSDVRSRAFAEILHRLSFSDERKLALLRLADVRVISTSDPAAPSLSGLRWLQPLPDGRALYAVEGSSPARVFFHAVEARNTREALRYTLARGLPRESVAVVEGTASFISSPRALATARIHYPRPNSFVARVEADSEMLLQTAVTFDPNWRIWLDGMRARPLVVDSVFLGVRAPAGKHEIRGEFRDPTFSIGAGISIVVLAGLLFALLPRSKRKTPAARPEAPPSSP